MNRFLGLLTHKGFFILMLVVFAGPIFYFHWDARLVFLPLGVLFILNGIGNLQSVRESGKFVKGLGCLIGGFGIALGICLLVGMVLFFITNTPLDVSSVN
jgi:hypothetical protein